MSYATKYVWIGHKFIVAWIEWWLENDLILTGLCESCAKSGELYVGSNFYSYKILMNCSISSKEIMTSTNHIERIPHKNQYVIRL